MYEGLLLVDKPAGWTSFDVVGYVRRQVATLENKKPKHVKVGHIGTLDPFATGLLVLLIGKNYTKQAGNYLKLDKRYIVTLQLGAISSTGDPEGEITLKSDQEPDGSTLEQAVSQFRGAIMQTPPAYSAIKIDGQRAYKLARAGQTVTIAARPVQIDGLEITSYTYPEVDLLADVSSGTYIRSLVEDIGEVLGVGAYTTALRRTRIGRFEVEDAVTIDELKDDAAAVLSTSVIDK